MSSQNPENPETTETGEGGGYGEPTPEQELGQGRSQAGAGQEQDHGQNQERDHAQNQPDAGQPTAAEERAGEQQDPVTGETLGPGAAESPG